MAQVADHIVEALLLREQNGRRAGSTAIDARAFRCPLMELTVGSGSIVRQRLVPRDAVRVGAPDGEHLAQVPAGMRRLNLHDLFRCAGANDAVRLPRRLPDQDRRSSRRS